MELIEKHRHKIYELCEEHKVQRLYIFGSILTNRFGKESDIDLLIQFYQVNLLDYFDNYMDLKEKLEDVLNRPVDLVENDSIKNPIFRAILDREKKLVYERKST